MTSIAIIDYGMGNLRSVAKAFEHIAPQARVLVTPEPPRHSPADRSSSRPGFDPRLYARTGALAFDDVVRDAALVNLSGYLAAALLESARKMAGPICLKVLPGGSPGLRSARSRHGRAVKVPHMAGIRSINRATPALAGDFPGQSLLFRHSYYPHPPTPHSVAARPATASTLPVIARTTSSPCNSTRRRAPRQDCGCSLILWTGTPSGQW